MDNNKSNHIKEFSVENFKRFKTFNINDIGQFNLILGDNSVGKTTFLESLLFDNNLSQFLHNLQARIVDKYLAVNINYNKINYLNSFFNDSNDTKYFNYFIKYFNEDRSYKLRLSNLSELSDEENNKLNTDSYLLNIINKTQTRDIVIFENNGKIELNVLNLSSHITNFVRYRPFIPVNFAYYGDLVDYYSKFFQPSADLKLELIDMLHLLEKDLEDIEIVPISSEASVPLNSLSARIKGKQKLMPFSMLGDGTSRILRILLEIAVCKDKRLMIDEIDNGIHYSHMSSFLKTVLKAADKNNVQLFFTTHSKDCIVALKKALSENEMKSYADRTRTYTLQELSNKNIKAYKYNFEEFEYAIDKEIELRGGVI